MKSPRDQEEAQAGEAQTKQVRITLSAYQLVEYTEIIQVPLNTTDDYLDGLVRDRYQAVSADEFETVSNYWEKSDCKWADAPAGEKPDYILVEEPDSEGDFALKPAQEDGAQTPEPSFG